MPDSFLFYRPRDVVSGDLPFVQTTADHIYLGAIDCTGHGVPAAMLSFMAYYSLSEIITRNEGTEPGKILSGLHDRIVQAKNRSGTERSFSDAMDISLCRVDKVSGHVCFAGSGMSMLVETNGTVSSTRGGQGFLGDVSVTHERTFITHEVPFQPSSVYYLYSDGVVDQFGGESGRKKFSQSRLMETIRLASGRPMPDTLEMVDAAFTGWKRDHEQTDDALLIGFSPVREALAQVA